MPCGPRRSTGSNCRGAVSIGGSGCRPGATAASAVPRRRAAWLSRCRKRAAAVADDIQAKASAQSDATTPARPADALIIVPVRNTVLFPGQVLPITLGRPKSISAAQQAVRDQRQVGILLQRDGEVADPTGIDMHRMGTVANIVRYLTAPDGAHHLVCQGEQRFQIVEYLSGWPFLAARVQRISEPA